MPIIPRYENSIGIRPVSTPTMQADTAVSSALKGLGDTVQKVGGEFADIRLKEQAAANKEKSESIGLFLSERRMNAELAIKEAKGTNAYGTPDKPKSITTQQLTEFDKASQDYFAKENLSDEQFKYALNLHAKERRGLEKVGIFHELDQRASVREETHKAYLANRENIMAMTATDPRRQDEYNRAVEESLAHVLEKARIDGVDPEQARQEYDLVQMKAASIKAKQLMLVNPIYAKSYMTENKDILGASYLKLEEELAPKLVAYQVGDVVEKSKPIQKDPNEPINVEEWYANIEKNTSDPEVKKLAYTEIKHKDQVRLDAETATYNYHAGTVLDAWEENPKLTMTQLIALPSFGELSTPQQGKLRADLRRRMVAMESTERARRSEERNATAQERIARAAEEANINREYDKNYYRENADNDRLARLPDDQFKMLRLEVGDKNFAPLQEKRDRLTSPKALQDTNEYTTVINGLIDAIPNFDDSSKASAVRKTERDIAAAQKKRGEKLSTDEVEAITIKNLQFEFVQEPGILRRKKIKRTFAIGKEDKILPIPNDIQKEIDTVKKKRGGTMTLKQEQALYRKILEQRAGDK